MLQCNMIKKALFSLFLLLLVLVSLLETFDTHSSKQLDIALQRSLTTFAVARGLNGLVSVVQGTEVNISPAGMGATFTPGQILDPINDMVERFSWVMLLSSVSISIQEVMLHLGKTDLFKISFTVVTLFLLLQLWIPKARKQFPLNITLKTVLLLVLLRFSVPLLVMLNEGVYDLVLAPQYEHSYEEVVKTSDEVSAMVQEVQNRERKLDEERSFIERFNVTKQYETFKQELRESVEAFIKRFNAAMESIISLITVFIVNSVLIPLGALWFFIYGFSYLMRQDLQVYVDGADAL